MRSLIRIVTAAVSSLVFMGCENAPLAPDGLAPGVPLASAVLNTIDRDITVEFPGCNGDVITGTANEHIVFSSSTDGAGGLHINFKDQLTNMRLTGSPSGATYVGGATSEGNVYVSPAEVLSGVVTNNLNINLIGQGQTPNLQLQGVLRIVISRSGIETVFTDTFTAICH